MSQLISKGLSALSRALLNSRSWSMLQDTAGRSDEEVDGMLRETVLFGCLSAISEAARNDLLAAPEDALVIPDVQAVSKDHPELTTQQVLDLQKACEREHDRLLAFVQNFALPRWYGRVMRLV